MVSRQRGSALSKEIIESIRFELAERGWAQEYWADAAHVSVSTVKRLLQGRRLDPSTLQSALGALGLNMRDCIVLPQQATIHTSVLLNKDTPTHDGLGFYMIATFVDTKRPQIESALRGLQALLVDSKVIFHEGSCGLTVSGTFESDKKKQIEMTIKHLEALFTTCTVTGDLIYPSYNHSTAQA